MGFWRLIKRKNEKTPKYEMDVYSGRDFEALDIDRKFRMVCVPMLMLKR